MYSLFQYDPKIEYGTLHLSEWTYLKDGFTRNLLALFDHYRHNSYSVKPDHLLCRIIQSIGIPLTLNSDRYMSNVYALGLTLASPFQLTSSINSGKVFNGVFYGKGNQEILIATDEWFDINKVEKNWRNLTPVRVITHPFTDLEMNIPDGQVKSREQGLVVLSINIALLAVMWRAFYQNELAMQTANPEYVMRNVMQFVAMYVLPNMLASHLDFALFNRIDRLQRKLPVHKTRSMHPVYQTDYSKQVTALQLRMLSILERSNYSFGATLFFIPAVERENMEKVMLMPSMTPTRQVLWAMVIARLGVLKFLINTAKYGAKMRDQKEVDAIGETLSKLKRQRVFDSVLPNELYDSTMLTIDEIVKRTQFTQIV